MAAVIAIFKVIHLNCLCKNIRYKLAFCRILYLLDIEPWKNPRKFRPLMLTATILVYRQTDRHTTSFITKISPVTQTKTRTFLALVQNRVWKSGSK